MLFALLAAAAAAAAATEVEIAARPAAGVVDRFHAALRAGDGNAALGLMSEDALVFESGHVEHGKAEYQSLHLDGDMEFSRAVKSITTARRGRAHGGIAWIASEGRTSGSFKGKTVDRATTETIILRRIAGQWRIVHIHWSSGAH